MISRETKPRRQKINIKSYDFDGCIFNVNYMDSKAKDRLFKHNKHFFEKQYEKIKKNAIDIVIFQVGSNRQDKGTDNYNSNNHKSGSCYPALEMIKNEFKKNLGETECLLDGYLLCDTYGKRPHGENFAKACSQDPHYHFSDAVFDESKVTLLYAQMHRAASKYPDAEIIFDFYDDRDDDILPNLAQFFQKNPDLIPHNVQLQLKHYAGDSVSNIAKIQGTGVIDHQYEKNIQSMIECASYDPYGTNNIFNNLNFNHQQRLYDFKMRLGTIFKELNDHINLIEQMPHQNAVAHKEFIGALRTLHENLLTHEHKDIAIKIASLTTTVLQKLQQSSSDNNEEVHRNILKAYELDCKNLLSPHFNLALSAVSAVAVAGLSFLIAYKVDSLTDNKPLAASAYCGTAFLMRQALQSLFFKPSPVKKLTDNVLTQGRALNKETKEEKEHTHYIPLKFANR